MFREMRRKRQALSSTEIIRILQRRTSGVLALSGSDGWPYAVPLSFVYDEGKIYFHCAGSGHKLDIIRQNFRASFCVIDQDQIVPEEYTTLFRSVILFGQIRILEDPQEKRAAIEMLAARYAPEDTEQNRTRAIDREWEPLCMLEMQIAHMSGKEPIELVKEKPFR